MSLTATILATTLARTSEDIDAYVQTGLSDAHFSAVVGQANQHELGKINSDFAKSYRFKSTNVWMKEPMMLRLEAKIEDQDIYFILNGANRLIRIPKSNINSRENLAKSPGKRQTALDFGLLTPSLFKGLFQAAFVRKDRATGDLVYDLTYLKSLDDTSRHRVWVDPVKKFTVKREWYSQNGGFLMATFLYENPVQQGGVYFPTHLVVKNAEGKVAGTTDYTNVHVNTGVSDDLFKVK